jgi:hypothetical protein
MNTITRTLLLFLLLASLSATLCAQEERAPATLFEAAQCLVSDPHHWVDVHGVTELNLAYLPESKSFGGARYIYVAVYTSAKHDQGTIYDIRLKDAEHPRVYSIENNASFVITPKEITFSEPPLGGAWRQNQLISSIKLIQRHRKWYEAQVKALLKPSTHFRCETNVEDVPPAK